MQVHELSEEALDRLITKQHEELEALHGLKRAYKVEIAYALKDLKDSKIGTYSMGFRPYELSEEALDRLITKQHEELEAMAIAIHGSERAFKENIACVLNGLIERHWVLAGLRKIEDTYLKSDMHK
jgi:hypothetical protein